MKKLKSFLFSILFSLISIVGGYLYSAHSYPNNAILEQLILGMGFSIISLFFITAILTLKETYFDKGKKNGFGLAFGKATMITIALWLIFVILNIN